MTSSPSPTNAELVQLAHTIADEFRDLPFVHAGLLTGSVSQGKSDDASDIDTIYFIDTPLPAGFVTAQKENATSSGGGIYGGDENGLAVYRYHNGIKIDLGFNPVAQIEEILTTVLDKHEIDALNTQLIIRGIRTGQPLFGAELLADWVARTDVYPDGLADVMVQKNLMFTPPWIVREMGAARGERFFVYELLLDNIKRLMSVLYGLNREYHPNKLKGVSTLAPTLEKAPADLVARLDALFALPLLEAADVYRQLIEETFALVATHMPHIEQEAALARWRMVLRHPSAS